MTAVAVIGIVQLMYHALEFAAAEVGASVERVLGSTAFQRRRAVHRNT
jgi:hypothetical protein